MHQLEGRIRRRPSRDTARIVAKLAAGAAAILLVAWLLRDGTILDIESAQRWLADLGPIGPAAYVSVYALQVIVAPVPGLPIGAAAGLAFGLWPALLFGSLGLTVGVGVAVLLGRHFGRRLLTRFLGASAFARWEQLRFVNSPVTWLLIFLGPSPDLILFVAGMSKVPLRVLIPVGLLGRAPAMATATLLGVGIADAGPWILIVATAIGFLFGCASLYARRFLPTAAPIPVRES